MESQEALGGIEGGKQLKHLAAISATGRKENTWTDLDKLRMAEKRYGKIHACSTATAFDKDTGRKTIV